MLRAKKIRKDRGMTQKQLFELTGVPICQISEWESGMRSLRREQIEKIAGILNADATEIAAVEGVLVMKLSTLEKAFNAVHKHKDDLPKEVLEAIMPLLKESMDSIKKSAKEVDLWPSVKL